MRLRLTILTIFAAIAAANLSAQYYDEGRDPFSIRWKQISGQTVRVIYPEQNALQAGRVATVIDTMRESLNYGFSRPPKNVPVILHGYNLQSNGVVSWAPKRSELVISPPTETFAVPWLKQLSIHEYRHVIQMSNLNRNLVKFLSVFTGEQVVGAAGLLLPQWFLEGDAVLAETMGAAYGRGLQPGFTLEYRAYLDGHDVSRFATDKWFCGSLKDYIPNHYYLGYQIAGMTYNKYGEGFWEKITDYSTRNPYLLAPRAIAYKKFYGTASKAMFEETFSGLKHKWDSLPKQENSAQVIETPKLSYTTYSHPVFINDTLLAAVKNDLVRTSRIVFINILTGEENVAAYTGAISSRPVYSDGELLWTEYRPSTFREQKNSSAVRRMAVNAGESGHDGIKTVRGLGNLFFITPYAHGFAAVEYGYSGDYSVKTYDNDFSPADTVAIPNDTTVHGLAWDEATNTLAAIALGEEGMFIAGLDPHAGTIFPITRPSYVTINNLSAGGGKLAYNSIYSGRDESHILDLRTGEEYVATASTYGSVMPSFSPDGGKLAQVTYREDGYFVSTQDIGMSEMTKAEYSTVPKNLFNMPLPEMKVTNADTLKLYEIDAAKEYTSKRYSKAGNMFNIHSWAPVLFDPFDLADDQDFSPDIGVTLISHNALSNTMGYAGWGIIDSESAFRGKLIFNMFAPKIEISAQYGGGDRDVYIGTPEGSVDWNLIPPYENKTYFELEAEASLPIKFSGGNLTRTLIPKVSLIHYNDLIYNYKTGDLDNGYQKIETSLTFSEQARMSTRDILPRWGYSIGGVMAFVPSRELFGKVYYTVGSLYTPGFAANNSLVFRGAFQYQDSELYNFRNSLLLPKGCKYNFTPKRAWTALADYRFPLAYPDGGISGLVYIKRIYANVFGGYSRFKILRRSVYNQAYSYGLELVFNTNLFRMSNGNVDFRISGYNAHDMRGTSPGVNFGISVNL